VAFGFMDNLIMVRAWGMLRPRGLQLVLSWCGAAPHACPHASRMHPRASQQHACKLDRPHASHTRTHAHADHGRGADRHRVWRQAGALLHGSCRPGQHRGGRGGDQHQPQYRGVRLVWAREGGWVGRWEREPSPQTRCVLCCGRHLTPWPPPLPNQPPHRFEQQRTKRSKFLSSGLTAAQAGLPVIKRESRCARWGC